MKMPCQKQRGGITLPIALLLVVVIFIGAAFMHRSVLLDLASSAHRHRAAQSFEMAEAGLAWGLAQLNNDSPVDAACQTKDDGKPLRDLVSPSLSHSPSLTAACSQTDGGLACQCAGDASFKEPGFSVTFRRDAATGLIQLTSTGCGRDASSCASGQGNRMVPNQIWAGRIPALDGRPGAALTVRGDASFASTGFELRHESAATGGITLHAGGNADTSNLALVSAPGTPGATSVAVDDTSLQQLSTEGLFASTFRMSKTAWRQQPAAAEVNCESACDTQLAEATSRLHGKQLVWLRGGLRLANTATLGSPERPLVLIADGPVELHAAAVIHGVIYTTHANWSDAAGATIHGAVIAEGHFQATGATHIRHDAAVLDALHGRAGSHAQVPGSWRDF